MKSWQRKGFQWSRLLTDYYCYRLLYHNAQCQMLPVLLVNQGQFVKKGRVVATAQEDGNEVHSVAPHSGTVIEVTDLSKPGLKLSNLMLLKIRRCDHQPDNQQLCRFCQQEVWGYEELAEREFRRYDFKEIQDQNGELTWKMHLNQHFAPSDVLGRIGDSEIQLDFRGRITFLGEGDSPNAVILRTRRTICKHEKVYQGLCCYCSEVVESQPQTSVVAQNNGVIMSGRMLEKAQQEVIDKLKEHRKIILILDLDNTILHCLQTTVQDTSVPTNLTDFFQIIFMDTVLVVKMRKYLRQFLAAVLPLYEIYIYTKGTREYSQRICQYIRSTYTELFEDGRNPEAFTPKRIVSRNEDADLDKKNIDVIFKKKGYVAIMDDRREVWGRPANAVSVKFYKYFDRSPTGQVTISTVDDFYLYFAKDYMTELHRRFYREVDEKAKSATGESPDFATIVRQQRRDMLKEYRAIFLLPGDLNKNYHYRRAHEFGITAAPSQQQANVVIYESSCLMKDSKRYENVLQLPLVHQSWLEYCYLYNFKFDVEMFKHKQGEDLGQMTAEKRDLFDEALFANHSSQPKQAELNHEQSKSATPEQSKPSETTSPPERRSEPSCNHNPAQ